MAKQYYCKIDGLDDEEYVEYVSEDHIAAASEYAKEVSRQVSHTNPSMFVKDMVVMVYCPDEKDFWRISVEMIHIRSV